MTNDDERDYAEEAWQRDNSDEKREAAAETTPEATCDCHGTLHAVGEGSCVLSTEEESAGYPTLSLALRMVEEATVGALIVTAREAVADWDAGRPEGMTGQALRDVVAGLLALRDKDTDHIFDLVRQVDEGLAARDRIAALTAERDEAGRQAAVVAGQVRQLTDEVHKRCRQIGELTADRDRLAAQQADLLAERRDLLALRRGVEALAEDYDLVEAKDLRELLGGGQS